MRRKLITTALCALLAMPTGAVTAPDADWQTLVDLDVELRELRLPVRVEDSARLAPDALAQRWRAIEAARQQLATIDPADWSVAGKIDYLLVWARINGLDFEHRVTRPWSRDPIFHLNLVRRVPYVELPLSAEEGESWRASLAAVPEALAQAEAGLTEASGELARLAIFHLENFDGVGQGQPYRDDPPSGTLGWFADLCERVERKQPMDLATCRAALAAVVGYRDWLAEALPTLASSAGIGTENLAWYFRNVRLLPYDVEEIALIGERELHRYRAAYQIVRNRNRDLPELELTTSAEMHERRTRDAERRIRELVERQRLMTFPDDLPETFETDTFWSPRALTDRHFWEEIQFRNAFNNHIHASIPGHRFDGLLARRIDNPIRRGYGDSSRAEGWATYLEEMFLLAGLTRDEPRADELFYAALIKRASRIYAETRMHAGEMTLDEANRYMIDFVPYMEEDLGRYDLEGYLRRPGLGSGYILGKVQLEQLLSERALALGEDFDLGAFHDRILASGMIPFVLVRWQMTGDENEVREIWSEAVKP